MKGTVFSCVEIQGKSGPYYKVQMKEGEELKPYLVKDTATSDAVKKGGELEYNVSPSKDGSANWMRIGGSKSYGGGGGGKQPSRDESFSCSYAKDIAVACINMGIVKSSIEIDSTILHYHGIFMKLLKG